MEVDLALWPTGQRPMRTSARLFESIGVLWLSVVASRLNCSGLMRLFKQRWTRVPHGLLVSFAIFIRAASILARTAGEIQQRSEVFRELQQINNDKSESCANVQAAQKWLGVLQPARGHVTARALFRSELVPPSR